MTAKRWAPAIRQARELSGLEASALARRLGVAVERVVALEGGAGDATVGELDALARELRVDFVALLRGDVRREPGATLAFRSRDAGWAALSDGDMAACERGLRSGRALLDVNERLGRARSARTVFVPREPIDEVEHDVRELSRQVRDELGNVDGKLPDLEDLYDTLDVALIEQAFASNDVDAVAVMEAGVGGGAAVLVRPASRAWGLPLRRRVLLAHELCHVLFDAAREGADAVVDFDVVDPERRRDSRYLAQDTARERRARAFAAELLMPTSALQKLLGAPRSVHDYGEALRLVDRVREHFGTPLEIALNQLWNRRYLAPIPNLSSDDPRNDLLEYLRWRGSAASAVVRPTAPTVDVLTRRVREAWDQSLCTDADARRWLSLSPFDPLPWHAAI